MMIRLSTTLFLIACISILPQRQSFAEESPYDREFATEDEFNLAFLKLNDLQARDILADLRKLELKDPTTLKRGFVAEVVQSAFSGNNDPEVITFLLDWIEFRSTLGPGKNPPSGQDHLYPAFMALKRRGPAVVPALLQHATAAPRSISYRHQVRHLLSTLIPDEKKRKKALVEFTDAHPELEEAMKIFDPPQELDLREVFRILRLPEDNPERIKYCEELDREKLYISVGQWKRMTEEAARKAQPVEKSPDAKR